MDVTPPLSIGPPTTSRDIGTEVNQSWISTPKSGCPVERKVKKCQTSSVSTQTEDSGTEERNSLASNPITQTRSSSGTANSRTYAGVTSSVTESPPPAFVVSTGTDALILPQDLLQNENEWPTLTSIRSEAPSTAVSTISECHRGGKSQDEVDDDPNWRLGSVQECYHHMWTSPSRKKYHDVKFELGHEKVIITAHKMMLITACESFHKYFQNKKFTQNITLPKLDAEGFTFMLSYIYTRLFNEADIGVIFSALECAKHFDYVDLVQKCTAFLRSRISNDSAVQVFCSAVNNKDKRLEEVAMAHIRRNAFDVVFSAGFLNLPEEDLCVFLANDEWYLDEQKVYEAVKRWAANKIIPTTSPNKIPGAELRTAMGNAFYGIRFPLFTKHQFCELTSATANGFLKNEELGLLCRYFFSPLECRESVPMENFITRNRKMKREQFSSPMEEKTQEEVNSNPLKIELKEQQIEIVEEEEQNEVDYLVPDEVLELELGNSAEQGEEEDDRMSYISIPSIPDRDDAIEMNNMESVHSTPRKRKRSSPQTPTSVQSQRPRLEDDNMLVNTRSSLNLSDYANSLFHDEESVNITEIKETLMFKIPNTRVYLPRLKKFDLTLTCNKEFSHGSAIKNHIKRQFTIQNLRSILFFGLHQRPLLEDENYNSGVSENTILQNIFQGPVNISLRFHGALLFQINHDSKTLIMNLLKDAQLILDVCCRNVGITKLGVSECELNSLESVPKDTLEEIVLRRVKGLKNHGTFLQQCPNLKKVCWNDLGQEEIDLGEQLLEGKENLEKLSLTKAKLVVAGSMYNLRSSVQELYLDNCNLPSELIAQLPKIFPCVRRVQIYQKKCDAVLLHSILQIPSIQWIFAWDVVYNKVRVPGKKRPEHTPESQTAFDFLAEVFDLDYAQKVKNTFILEKKITVTSPKPSTSSDAAVNGSTSKPFDPRCWTGTKLLSKDKYVTVSQWDFSNNSYNQFFDCYDIFSKFETTEKDVQKQKPSVAERINNACHGVTET